VRYARPPDRASVVRINSVVLVPPSPAAAKELAPLVQRLKDPATELTALLQLWRVHTEGGEPWTRSPEIYQLLGDRTLKLGQFLVAYDVATAGLERWPRDVRLRQLQGLALARVGLNGTSQPGPRAATPRGPRR
jgi:hypothetical protein